MADDAVKITQRMAAALPPDERAAWDSLISELSGEVPDPQHVELVITDRFDRVVGEYAVRMADRANPDETARDYHALKPDGAMAAARTMELAGGTIVVIVNAALPKLGPNSASRMLLHEAQHVRLHQDRDSAWVVHRRVNFDLPNDLTWMHIWLAETVIDEFRCERSAYEIAGSDPAMLPNAADSRYIIDAFEPVRDDYRRTHDLMAAMQGSYQVLQRLAVFLAYGGAYISSEPVSAKAWTDIPSMPDLLDILLQIPSATNRIGSNKLAALSVDVARVLRTMWQEMGFDCYFLPDGSMYFTVLH